MAEEYEGEVQGLAYRVLRQDVPERYFEDDFVRQLCYTLGCELEQFHRWVHFDTDYQKVLDNPSVDWFYEGVFNHWFARLADGDALTWWENFLGISTNSSLTRVERTNNLVARMAQRSIAPTVEFINGLVEQFVEEASTTVQVADRHFTITILNPRANIPDEVKNNIVVSVDAAKPAHLDYDIVYTETDWAGIAARSWADIGDVAWATMTY